MRHTKETDSIDLNIRSIIICFDFQLCNESYDVLKNKHAKYHIIIGVSFRYMTYSDDISLI